MKVVVGMSPSTVEANNEKSNKMKSKKKYRNIASALLLMVGIVITNILTGQTEPPDFSSFRYKQSIDEMNTVSEGKITVDYLQDVFSGNTMKSPSSPSAESLSLNPDVFFVPYTGSSKISTAITLSAAVTKDFIFDTLPNRPYWFTHSIPAIVKDQKTYTIDFTVGRNPSSFARWVGLVVTNTIGTTEVKETLYILQDPDPTAPKDFIYVTPPYHLKDNSPTTVTYTVYTSGKPTDDEFFLAYSQSDRKWYNNNVKLTPSTKNENEYKLEFEILKNDNPQARLGTLTLRANINNDSIGSNRFGVVQEGKEQAPFIFLSPASEIAEPEDKEATFTIITSEYPDKDPKDGIIDLADFVFDFEHDTAMLSTFTFDTISKNEITLQIGLDTNDTGGTRFVAFTMAATLGDKLVPSEEVVIIQKSTATSSFIFASPDLLESSSKVGPTKYSNIISYGTGGWEFTEGTGDTWVSKNEIKGNTISFLLEGNTSNKYFDEKGR